MTFSIRHPMRHPAREYPEDATLKVSYRNLPFVGDIAES